jgi:mRNA-degrading endonuclease toxin of MazEF toxin-antitoxin module
MAGTAQPPLPQPLRGEIWDVDFPSDPPGKGPRPVLIISPDGRNRHPKATTVLVVPFSTTMTDYPTHIRLSSGQTGLPGTSEIQPEQITAVRKEYLKARSGTRTQAESVIALVAKNVLFALGVQPKDVQ